MKKFKLSYEKDKNALLLGNGINNLNPDANATWRELLKKLDPDINLKEKPYPLAFEEIVLKMSLISNNYEDELKTLKGRIANLCGQIELNKYHFKLRNIKVDTFLSTNYDYLIEKCLDVNFIPTRSKDSKYSTYRYHEVGGKKVWHIHGEIDNGFSPNNSTRYSSASILIGHEHYGDYYNKIHQYLKPYGLDSQQEIIQNERESWLKYFFTHNLHIAGFSLDNSEFHLWWLLAYRARQIMQNQTVNNKVIFHYPSYDYTSRNARSKLELLESFDVKLEPIEVLVQGNEKYTMYWDVFFKEINNIITHHSNNEA